VTARRVVLAYLEQHGRVLLTRRPAGTPLAGLWEFPGGKVEPGEAFHDALRRELCEEIGVAAEIGDELAVVRYAYPEVEVELHLFRCTLPPGAEPVARQVAALRWVTPDTLADIPMPPANALLLAALARRDG
jgi:8-oxo-dGTP diphosphatase